MGHCLSTLTAAWGPISPALAQDRHGGEAKIITGRGASICPQPSSQSVLQTPPHWVLKGSRQEECWLSKVRPPPREPTSLQEQLASPGGGAWPECPTCSGLLGYSSRRSSATRAHAKRNISDAQLGCSQASAAGCLPCLLTHSRTVVGPNAGGPGAPARKNPSGKQGGWEPPQLGLQDL